MIDSCLTLIILGLVQEKPNADLSDDDGKKGVDAPKDQEFEVGMVNTRLDSPHMKLPEAKDRLFVTKPLMNYEPNR